MSKKQKIDEFLTYIRATLQEDVHSIYFGLNYWAETDKAPINDDAKAYLRRYHERVFCYELYHQLRLRLHANPDLFQDIFLQSEVIKAKLPTSVWQQNQVKNLSKNFMPDFVLHSPGNFDNQLVVMEVKSSPTIKAIHIKNDINKIAEFIDRYNYECGVFLAVNTTTENIENMLDSQKEIFSLIPKEYRERIIVMVQEMPSRNFSEFSLQKLFNE